VDLDLGDARLAERTAALMNPGKGVSPKIEKSADRVSLAAGTVTVVFDAKTGSLLSRGSGDKTYASATARARLRAPSAARRWPGCHGAIAPPPRRPPASRHPADCERAGGGDRDA